jgi:5-methylcytosine-specific restriction endonuclease McrA
LVIRPKAPPLDDSGGAFASSGPGTVTTVRQPIRPCIEFRCPEYTLATRCEKHQAEFEAKRRANPSLTGRRGTTADWRRARGLALWRAGYRCRDCGISQKELEAQGKSLEVHHVDGDAHNDRQSNLRPLCPPCHRAA